MPYNACAKCGNIISSEQTSCPVCGSTDRIVFAVDQADVTDREDAEMELAMRHFEVEPGLTQIYRITDTSEVNQAIHPKTIKLLEVNTNTVESGIMALHFGPAPASGIPFPSIVIEVTPNELEKIRSHELKLPAGWEIGEELPRPVNVEGI